MKQSAKPVLFVDDDDCFRGLIAACLRCNGIQIIEATSGSDALEKFNAHRFRAILTDLQMPGMNGIELLCRLKMLQQDLPIYILTGTPRVLESLPEARLADAVISKDCGCSKTIANLCTLLGSPISRSLLPIGLGSSLSE